MHVYSGVLTILDLACFLLYFVFCVSGKVKLIVSLLRVCVHSACKGRPRNDLYCVGWDVKPYSLTHSFTKWCSARTLANISKVEGPALSQKKINHENSSKRKIV